jgi:hypothetical protein
MSATGTGRRDPRKRLLTPAAGRVRLDAFIAGALPELSRTRPKR